MVWFYHAITSQQYGEFQKLSIPLWSDFIFSSIYPSSAVVFAFNPTMVWFYLISTPRYGSSCAPHGEHFQSHYGLILSVIKVKRKGGGKNFQSHYGLILSMISAGENKYINYIFQSHYGLILSIVYWLCVIVIVAFQSHYGLILSAKIAVLSCSSNLSFNPTMVWFYQKLI